MTALRWTTLIDSAISPLTAPPILDSHYRLAKKNQYLVLQQPTEDLDTKLRSDILLREGLNTARARIMPFRNTGGLLLKPDGRILFATTYFCDLVGVNLEKVAEMSCFDFVFPGDMEAARELFMATKLQKQEPIRFRLRRLDGTEVWTDIQSTPMKAETGTVCAITATVTGAKGDR